MNFQCIFFSLLDIIHCRYRWYFSGRSPSLSLWLLHSLLASGPSSPDKGLTTRVFLLFKVTNISSGGPLITGTPVSHGSKKSGWEGCVRGRREGSREPVCDRRHYCRSCEPRPTQTLRLTLCCHLWQWNVSCNYTIKIDFEKLLQINSNPKRGNFLKRK